MVDDVNESLGHPLERNASYLGVNLACVVGLKYPFSTNRGQNAKKMFCFCRLS